MRYAIIKEEHNNLNRNF